MKWWSSFYDDLLAEVLFADTAPEEIVATVAFLERELALRSGDRVFDQCCGTGRTSAELARRGYQITGIDQAENYIRAARASAESDALHAEYHVADAFQYEEKGAFNAAFNWWTSFGYEREDDANLLMLDKAFRSLAPGGRFALDFMNVPGVCNRFEPMTETRVTTNKGEIVLTRLSRLDLESGLMLKTWRYTLPDGAEVEHKSEVRLYQPWELRTLFESVGFEDVQIFGDLQSGRLAMESPRCIVVGKSPGS